MKYFFTLLVSILFIVPSFAQRKSPLTLSRSLVEDMARKSLTEFKAKYLVASPALSGQVDKAFFSSQDLPVQEDNLASMETEPLADDIYRTIEQQGGYIPSFPGNSKTFIETTGLHYSDMAVMLRHALNEPMSRNFSGYFVKDFREIQLAAIRPATGQTLDEALRTAFQQANGKESGILIITEEQPAQYFPYRKPLFKGGPNVEQSVAIPSGLKDLYVMDWANGRWISYRQSILDSLWKGRKKGLDTKDALPFYGAEVTEKENGHLNVESGRIMEDSLHNKVFVVTHLLDVSQDSPWFEQLQYAQQKGYYVLIKDLPGAGEDSEDLSKVTFLFARKRGDPLFDNVYDLERSL